MIEIEDYSTDKRADHKRELFEATASTHAVSVQLDARRPGVLVPEPFRNTPNLILKFSPRFGTELSVGLDGIRQEINFPRFGTFEVRVPWSAVYSIHADKHGAEVAVWASDVPRELQRAFGLKQAIAN